MGHCCVHVHSCTHTTPSIPKDTNIISVDNNVLTPILQDDESFLIRRSASSSVFHPIKIQTICISNNANAPSGEKCLQSIHKEISKRMTSSHNFKCILKASTRNLPDKDILINNNKSDKLTINVNNNVNNINTTNNDNDKELSSYEVEKLHDVLTSIFMFANLTEATIQLIISELIRMQLPHGKVIYDKGFEGHFFFIVGEGKVNLLLNNKLIRTYTQWECFGHMSLLYEYGPSKTKNTAQCDGDVTLFVLDSESFQVIRKELIKVRLEEQFNFITQMPLFASLDAVAKYNIAEKITINEYTKGDKIIDNKLKHNTSNNTNNNVLFLIKTGTVELRKQHKFIKQLGINEYFGVEKVLLDESTFKSNITVIASTITTTCYQISKGDLIEALGIHYKDIILLSLFKCFIRNHKYFTNIFSDNTIEHVFKGFELVYYKNKSDIRSTSKSNQRIILVIEGNIIHTLTHEHVASRGSVLGEDIIKHNTELSQHMQAFPNLLTLECDVDKLYKILHLDAQVHQHLRQMKHLNQLKTMCMFKFVSDELLMQIHTRITKRKYKSNDIIIKEGYIGEEFFLIHKGRVTIEKNGTFIREIERGNCFGEMALMYDMNMNIRTATVKAVDNVTCFVISKCDFVLLLNNTFIHKYITHKIAMQNVDIALDKLMYVKTLGKGRYGHVVLARHDKSNYALKTIPIKQAIKDRMTQYMLSEKTVLQLLDHPFIIKLVKTLKDNKHCFFLLEYVNGVSLNDYLVNRCLLYQPNETKFYTACLLIVVNYLHSKNVAHRDIKPNNIMIDKHGYIKLVDFGTAKILNNYTSTVIGTPQYTAPEIIKGKGYSISCDYWSIGVCAYEIFYGRTPFGNNCGTDVVTVYNSILSQQPQYSMNCNYRAVDEVIRMMLEKKVNRRVCSVNVFKKQKLFNVERSNGDGECRECNGNGTYQQCKDYFDMVMNMEIKPPFVPVVNSYQMKESRESVLEYFKKAYCDDYINNNNNNNSNTNEGKGEEDKLWMQQF